MPYDFEGWASKNDLKCADGVIIKKNAFSKSDGKTVPLVWNHRHNSVSDVLGHALLKNRDEGIYAYCCFNNTPNGQNAKEAIKHGDVTSLSIWANNIEKIGNDVVHGVIREVSLVLAGANPGAFIESIISHGETMLDDEDEGILYTGDNIYISHAENKNDEGEEMEEKSVVDVFNEMTEEQQAAVGVIVQQALEEKYDNDEEDEEYDNDEEDYEEDYEEEKEMKHNVFENGGTNSYISHSDVEQIFIDAKRLGSLKESVNSHIEDGVLSHAIPTTGMTVATGTQTYGINDASMLFPDYKSINNPPEWIKRNMDWVGKVMSGVHHTPFSRIKSLYANITEDEARAKGYIKGKMKKEEVFTTLKRTTDPQTIYKKQKLDRDDIIDITDFDVVAWIRAEMRVMLDEEIARAILIGDGRASDSDDKIKEANVRPIAMESALYNTVIKVTVPTTATQEDISKETIKSIIRGRKKYKGSGKPTFFTTEDVLTEMLLLDDDIGHPLYKTEEELSTKLRVNEIVTVEPMENHELTIDSKKYKLLGIVVNLADYNVGADKGGEINMFDDFDIDYNQQKYLIETRISGALVKPFSALTIVLDKTASTSSGSSVSLASSNHGSDGDNE